MAPKKKEELKQNEQPLEASSYIAERTQLLPIIALGWGPVDTRSGGGLCGLYALERAVNEVWATTNPGSQLITFNQLRAITNRPDFRTILRNFLQDVGRSLGSLASLSKQKSWYNDEFLEAILWQVNQEHGTNFRLGIVRAGLGDTVNHSTILGDFNDPGPIVWIFNDGDDGGRHWSGFAAPPFVDNDYRHDVLRIMDLHADARRLLSDNNIFRIIPGDEPIDGLAYDGEYVVAVPGFPNDPLQTYVNPVASLASDNIVTRVIGNVPTSRLEAIDISMFVGVLEAEAEAEVDAEAEVETEAAAVPPPPPPPPPATTTPAGQEGGGTGQPKAKRAKTTTKDVEQQMLYLKEPLDLGEHYFDANDLFLQTGDARRGITPCRDIQCNEFEIQSSLLTPIRRPWGIRSMYKRYTEDELDAMKYRELQVLQTQVLGTVPRAEGHRKSEIAERLKDLYADLKPLKMLEVSWDAFERQPDKEHFRHVYLLDLNSQAGNKDRRATVSVQQTAEWVPVKDLAQTQYIQNPWGLLVNEENPSSIGIPEEDDEIEDPLGDDDLLEWIEPRGPDGSPWEPLPDDRYTSKNNPINGLMVILLEYILTTGNNEGRTGAIVLWPQLHNKRQQIVSFRPINVGTRQPDAIAELLIIRLRNFQESLRPSLIQRAADKKDKAIEAMIRFLEKAVQDGTA